MTDDIDPVKAIQNGAIEKSAILLKHYSINDSRIVEEYRKTYSSRVLEFGCLSIAAISMRTVDEPLKTLNDVYSFLTVYGESKTSKEYKFAIETLILENDAILGKGRGSLEPEELEILLDFSLGCIGVHVNQKNTTVSDYLDRVVSISRDW